MSKRIIITIIVYGILLITFGALSLSIFVISKSEESQLAAQRWNYSAFPNEDGEKPPRYTQLSAFISDGVFNEDSILQLRSTIDNTLSQESIKAVSDSARVWLDAYSVEKNIRIDNVQTDVTAIGVGGDFFIFHNLPLLAGTYFNPESEILDLVVIDEVLAWQTFGSYDVIGLDLFINDSPYKVVGTVSRKFTDFYNDTYGENPRIYMSYKALNILNNHGLSITCYEALMPNPVSNFAMKILNENLNVPELNVIYKENTYRFSLLNLYKSLGDFNYRSIRQNNVIFPYWENIATVKTDKCAVLLLFNTFIFTCIIGFTVYQIVYIIKKYDISFKTIIKRLENIKFKRKS